MRQNYSAAFRHAIPKMVNFVFFFLTPSNFNKYINLYQQVKTGD